jgi:hypothetical protein
MVFQMKHLLKIAQTKENGMRNDTVRQGNIDFFVNVVGILFGTGYSAQTIIESLNFPPSQFPTHHTGKPGYVRIDTSEISKAFRYEFVDKVRRGIHVDVSSAFDNDMNFKDFFAEKVEIEKDGYRFSFHIKEYQRDSVHESKSIELKDLTNIPENEQLGRVVYLTISSCQSTNFKK